MAAGKLLLLPNLLEEGTPSDAVIPPAVGSAVASLDGLIAESEKSGRRFMRLFVPHEKMAATPIRLLNEHTPYDELMPMLIPILGGETWGLISDAGLPCIADPGAELVRLAHEREISVQTFAGPSSILMALQLSGFSGQKFSFHGYLPRETAELEAKIEELENACGEGTQIWIEAPYRSQKMLDTLKRVLQPKMRLAVAASLTTMAERVASMEIGSWRVSSFSLEKEPAVFLLSH